MRIIPVATKDLDRPELQMYRESSEVQLRRCYEPEQGCFIAESLRVIARAREAGFESLSLLIEERHLQDPVIAACGDIPVYVGSEETLSSLAGYKLTGGALCLMRRRTHPEIPEIIADAKHLVVLERINNPTNVGAIFRSAAALGADALLLTSDCSDPLYRRAARVSMGTVFSLPWTYFDSRTGIDTDLLQQAGYTTIAMALTDGALPLDRIPQRERKKTAVFLGNENDGLSSSVVSACDYTAVIPMQRGVDSLNVAAASAVTFWELFRHQ